MTTILHGKVKTICTSEDADASVFRLASEAIVLVTRLDISSKAITEGTSGYGGQNYSS